MAENQRRMEELGIKNLAYEVTCSRKDQKRREISKVISKDDVANDDEYVPDEEEHEPEKSSNENDAYHRRRLSSRSTKVVAVKGSSGKGFEKPHSSMASLLNMHRQTLGVQEKLRKDGDEKEMNSLEIVQRDTTGEKEHPKQDKWTERLSRLTKCHQMKAVVHSKLQGKDIISNTSSSKKTAQSKVLVSPGSLSAYVRMRKSSTAEKEPQTITGNVSTRKGHLFDDVGGIGVGLVEENEADESLHEYVSEGEGEDDMNPKEIENDVVEIVNEPFSDQEPQTLPVTLKKKQTRGPSLCKDIHDRTLDNRLPIILNELCQPIGPDKATLDKFSRFLGSLARDSNLAPLNEINWTHVRDKDKIWEYVKKKFIIAEEGKTYVLQSIGALWRTHKSRVKKKYYYNSTSQDTNGENKSIPDSHLKDLLKYWDLEEVQMISEKRKAASQSQKNRHTMGPVAFARKRHELKQVDGKQPSLELMYTETHKRTSGRKYKTPEINDELSDSISNGLLAGVLKVFEHLPVENSLSVQELAKHLIREQLSGDINNDELPQDEGNEDGGSEANDDGDDHGHGDRVEK
ncbi:Unknown protein [Striga hermonthica]|uniref:Uncharacterized protein n=1 Tax=Striga hermonthica TaxID=68872 RepID=A0A9N7RNG8_STRHE|nr:Unknown protein [Striga hermonthica]